MTRLNLVAEAFHIFILGTNSEKTRSLLVAGEGALLQVIIIVLYQPLPSLFLGKGFLPWRFN